MHFGRRLVVIAGVAATLATLAGCDQAPQNETPDVPRAASPASSGPDSAPPIATAPPVATPPPVVPVTSAPPPPGRDTTTKPANPPRKPGTKSTLTGVFTQAQVAQGEQIYAGMCRSCHAGATHTSTFKTNWGGYPLAELFSYMMTAMPKNDPGSLSAEDNAVVLAYLLKMMGMPAGTTPLPADSASLAKIQFDTLPAR